MKPDSSIVGRKKKNVICIACSWFCASDESVMPTVRLAAMNSSDARRRAATTLPDDRHVEEVARREQDDRRLDQPDDDVGHDLAGHHLERPRRRREQVLHRAALALARHREAGHHHHRHRQDHAHQPGHDVVLRDRLRGCRAGARAPRTAPARRRSGASGPVRSLRWRPTCASSRTAASAAPVAAGIGGVGLDQQRRALAAQQLRARSRPGIVTTNCTSPRASARVARRPRPAASPTNAK